jgi:hypothetical protein
MKCESNKKPPKMLHGAMIETFTYGVFFDD